MLFHAISPRYLVANVCGLILTDLKQQGNYIPRPLLERLTISSGPYPHTRARQNQSASQSLVRNIERCNTPERRLYVDVQLGSREGRGYMRGHIASESLCSGPVPSSRRRAYACWSARGRLVANAHRTNSLGGAARGHGHYATRGESVPLTVP